MTEIQIRDPDPDPNAGGAAEGPGEPESPYKNLLVPLVVVPALIVMVLVMVFALFSGVVGSEDSPRENLDRVLNGGFNERRQAAFALVRQVLLYQQARARGERPEWEIDATFLPALAAARAQLGPPASADELATAFVLSSLLAEFDDPDGVSQLIDMLELSDALDPGGQYRMNAIATLGALGPGLAEPVRARAAGALIGLLASPDNALVLSAIAGLQRLPGEATRVALEERLTSERLEVRASAALSLAELGDPAGRAVLEEMLALAPYEAEHAANPRKWPPQVVSESRIKALDALVALGAAPDELTLRRLGREDPDPNVRRAALARAAGEPAR